MTNIPNSTPSTGRRGSYAAVAAASITNPSSSVPSTSASAQSSPANKRVDLKSPVSIQKTLSTPPPSSSSTSSSKANTPQAAPLIPTAILDPTSRQAKWAAYEAQRRASLSGPSGQIHIPVQVSSRSRSKSPSRSKSRSRSRSKSPKFTTVRRGSFARASVSNINDEVVAMANRSVSPPSASGSSHSTGPGSPPHPYTAPHPPSPNSALGMTWNDNSKPITRARGDSNSSVTGYDKAALATHAAELMNIAARKMANKGEERASALAAVRRDMEPGEVMENTDVDAAGEEYDQFDTPTSVPSSNRSRSKSISSYDQVQGRLREFQPSEETGDLATIWGRVQANHRAPGSSTGSSAADALVHGMHRSPQIAVSGPTSTVSGPASPANNMIPHRRSSTFSYASAGPWGPAVMTSAGESTPPGPASAGPSGYPSSLPSHMHASHMVPFNSLPSSPDRVERMRSSQRRFSVSPNVASGDYDPVVAQMTQRSTPLDNMSPRRHSVAGAYQPPGRRLSDALASLSIEPEEGPGPGGYNNLMIDLDEYYGHTPDTLQSGIAPGSGGATGGLGGRRASTSNASGAMGSGPGSSPSSSFSEVGRGIPLHVLPSNTLLYIVEFKAGRSDIYYFADETGSNQVVNKGDLVIVEADRGKDLGKVINNSITPHQIHLLQAQQSDALSDLHRVNREIHPKRIYRLAQPQEVQMLMTKMQDEAKALAVCQTKVRQKKLPMNVVDAEYQWDRRKLTFYFIADRRIDFRELVRDLFKIYKTRIWMCAVSAIHKAPYQQQAMNNATPSSPNMPSPNSSGDHLSPTFPHDTYLSNGGSPPSTLRLGSPSSSPKVSRTTPVASTLGFIGHPGYQAYPGFPVQGQGSPDPSPVLENE